MLLDEITQRLRKGTLAPGELSDCLLQLSGEYSYTSSQLEEILKRKPQIWLDLREQSKSDAQADKKWESSEFGLQETIHRLQLKSMEKQMSAIKTRLHIAEIEARNQY